MTRMIAALAVSALLAACAPAPKPVGSLRGSCEVFRPAFPISYDRLKDTPETVKGVKQANARFASACG